jgi:hypothetical protein
VDSEQKISVKERMQKFNRLAETDMKTHPVASKKKIDRVCQTFYLNFSSSFVRVCMFISRYGFLL